MIALLTSCNRPDLLMATLNSFLEGMDYQLHIAVHEDSKERLPEIDLGSFYAMYPMCHLIYTDGMGQNASIQRFLMDDAHRNEKYYLHLEDDWEFKNSYDWISQSVALMEANEKIIKILARDGSPHPCVHDCFLDYGKGALNKYGYLEPWTADNGTKWHGFSWNPGVTRLDLLRKFVPFPKWEQELAEQIHHAGYQVVELAKSVYKHIGDGRSTH